MNITELVNEYHQIFFIQHTTGLKEFCEKVAAQLTKQGKDEGYQRWFMRRVIIPKVHEKEEALNPGKVPKSYWDSYDYLKHIEYNLKRQGRSVEHLQPKIKKWLEYFAQEKARRAYEWESQFD